MLSSLSLKVKSQNSDSFIVCVAEMLEDSQLSWGRIIKFFGFLSYFSDDETNKIEEYLDSKIPQWTFNNGGWNQCIKLFSDDLDYEMKLVVPLSLTLVFLIFLFRRPIYFSNCMHTRRSHLH